MALKTSDTNQIASIIDYIHSNHIQLSSYILDSTLRDGAYAFGNAMPVDYVQSIALNLGELVDFLEVGSSLSFGYGHNKSLEDDQIRFETVCKYSTCALPTVFIQPYLWEEIGSPKLSSIFSVKPGLIRIGIDPELEPSIELDLIDQCAELCIPCALNLMKVYKFPHSRLLNLASNLDSIVHYVSLVDSSGCMLPSEIEELLKKLARIFKASFSLHIHNNTGYANAISIEGLSSGYSVDSTLLGKGRAGGNADTCLLVLKKALLQNTSLEKLDLILNKLLAPSTLIWGNKARDHIINILLGLTSLHSSQLSNHKLGTLNMIPSINDMYSLAWRV